MTDSVIQKHYNIILIFQKNWIVSEESHGAAGGSRKGKGLWFHNF
jgi:hypothetical protein